MATGQKTNVGFNGIKTIRETTVIARLEDFFGKQISDLNESITDFVGGNAGAVRSLANALDNYDGFHDDELGLTPGDMEGVTTIGLLDVAILVWYARDGWNVIHRPMGG